MKTYVLFITNPWNFPKWDKISNPTKYNIVLIVNEKCFNALKESDKKLITEIYKTEDFGFENLRLIIKNQILPKYKNILIITSHELLLLTCAKLREHFEVEGDKVKDISPFRDKIIMKQKLEKLGVLPKYLKFSPQEFLKRKDKYVNQIIDHLGLPVFVKPIAFGGSMDCKKIDHKEDLTNWCIDNINSDKEFEIDEFISGETYHCDSIIRDKKTLHVGIGKYITSVYRFLYGAPNGSIIVPEDDPDIPLFKEFNQRIISAFEYIPNGTTHLQFFKTSENRLIFIEIAARPPGGLISQMYQKHANIDYITLHHMLQMNLDFDLQLKRGPYAAFFCFPHQKGKVSAIHEPTYLKSKYKFEPKVKIGDVLNEPKFLLDIAAELLLWNENYQELFQDFISLTEYKVISVED